jgi:hypothetical protein
MKLQQWHLQSRRYAHAKVTELYLYPELDCSACVQELDDDATGDEQLRYYCDYIKNRYPQLWKDDAVPILWTVMGDGDGFGCEFAPCHSGIRDDNVLTYYHSPINVKTGEGVNWYRLPVMNRRFPAFAKALGWLPSPFQMTAPLRSIVSGMPISVPLLKKKVNELA